MSNFFRITKILNREVGCHTLEVQIWNREVV